MEFWIDLSEIIRNVVIAFGAAFGLFLAWERLPRERSHTNLAEGQARLARRDQAWELFNRSVTQLGDKKLEVRLGAIYTLSAICYDFDEMQAPVIELLTAYIRDGKRNYGEGEPPTDVREILRIIQDGTKHS